MSDIPEHLLRRSAEAKAAALGVPVEQVLAEMKGEVPAAPVAAGEQPKVEAVETPASPVAESVPEPAPEPASEPVEPTAAAAPVATAPAAAAPSPAADAGEIDYEAAAAKAGMPASLLQRSVEAKAKAGGLSAGQVLAEMLGEEAPSAPVASAPAAVETVPEPEPADVPAAGEIDYEAAAAKAGMPASLLQRSVEAKAKAGGLSAGQVLAEMLGEEAPSAPVASAPAAVETVVDVVPMPEAAPVAAASVEPVAPSTGAAPAGATRLATSVSPRPVAQPEGLPEGVRTQRLLTVVKAEAIQQVKAEPSDKVHTWPHLMIMEFAALLAVTALLIVLSVILQAPLLESANFNATPNPSKAPWYFLGLQELLSYFDPQIAGVTVPTIIGLIGFMAIPYVDKNPSNKPSDRKFAIFMYTFFMMGSATLTILGVLFRGPGFNFTYPWADGIWFDDLKDWVNFE